MDTLLPASRLLPVMLTMVPPDTGPRLGIKLNNLGICRNQGQRELFAHTTHENGHVFYFNPQSDYTISFFSEVQLPFSPTNPITTSDRNIKATYVCIKLLNVIKPGNIFIAVQFIWVPIGLRVSSRRVRYGYKRSKRVKTKDVNMGEAGCKMLVLRSVFPLRGVKCPLI